MQTIRTNLFNNASTQYTNYDFTSMCEFNGKILGAGAVGIRQLGCGTTDVLEDVNASFKTGEATFGYDGNKRLGYIYLGIETDGDMTVTPYFDGVTMPVVEFSPEPSLTRQNIMSRVGRGEKGVYMSFLVENVEGAQFSLDCIHTSTTNLNR
jgi:hypothetical protein